MTTGSRAASQATRLRFRNASLKTGLGASRITTWSTLAASIFSRHWSERKSRLRRVPTRSIEPCAEPVKRTSTKSPQVASWRLPLRVHTTWRRSANSTRNSRPKSAMTRPSTTTDSLRSRRVVMGTGTSSARRSDLEQGVELGGADEVVLRQAVDGVGDVAHLAFAPLHDHVRVVVLAVGHPRGGVHERHRLEVVLELVRLGDHPAVLGPAVESLEQGLHLLRREGSHPALAGHALLARELVHGVAIRSMD